MEAETTQAANTSVRNSHTHRAPEFRITASLHLVRAAQAMVDALPVPGQLEQQETEHAVAELMEA